MPLVSVEQCGSKKQLTRLWSVPIVLILLLAAALSLPLIRPVTLTGYIYTAQFCRPVAGSVRQKLGVNAMPSASFPDDAPFGWQHWETDEGDLGTYRIGNILYVRSLNN